MSLRQLRCEHFATFGAHVERARLAWDALTLPHQRLLHPRPLSSAQYPVSAASAARARGGLSCRRLAGRGDLMPDAPVRVEPVTAVLAGSSVADVGIERVAVIRGLQGAV